MDGTGDVGERNNEPAIITHQSHEASGFCQVFGTGQSTTARTFSGSGSIPLPLTTCPRNFVFNWSNLHFAVFNFNLALCRRSITNLSFWRCRSNVSAMTLTSSKYTRQTSQVSPARTRSIDLWNNAGALVKPKLSTLNRKVPFFVTKAVLSADSDSIAACQ